MDNLKQWLKEQSTTQLYELSNISIDRLKQWLKQRIITQLLRLGNLDVDGFEQWWQEHSSEVNERLTDMK